MKTSFKVLIAALTASLSFAPTLLIRARGIQMSHETQYAHQFFKDQLPDNMLQVIVHHTFTNPNNGKRPEFIHKILFETIPNGSLIFRDRSNMSNLHEAESVRFALEHVAKILIEQGNESNNIPLLRVGTGMGIYSNTSANFMALNNKPMPHHGRIGFLPFLATHRPLSRM